MPAAHPGRASGRSRSTGTSAGTSIVTAWCGPGSSSVPACTRISSNASAYDVAAYTTGVPGEFQRPPCSAAPVPSNAGYRVLHTWTSRRGPRAGSRSSGGATATGGFRRAGVLELLEQPLHAPSAEFRLRHVERGAVLEQRVRAGQERLRLAPVLPDTFGEGHHAGQPLDARTFLGRERRPRAALPRRRRHQAVCQGAPPAGRRARTFTHRGADGAAQCLFGQPAGNHPLQVAQVMDDVLQHVFAAQHGGDRLDVDRTTLADLRLT
jgi:hypothetical protein